MKRFRISARTSLLTASLVICLTVPIAATAQTDGEPDTGYGELGELIGAFLNGQESDGVFTAIRPEDQEALSPFGGASQLPPDLLGDITPRLTFTYVINWGTEPVTNPYPDATTWCPDPQYPPPDSGELIPPLGSSLPALNEAYPMPWGLVFPTPRTDILVTPASDEPALRGGLGLFFGVQIEGSFPSDGCDARLWEFGWGGTLPGFPAWEADPAFPNDVFNGLSHVWVARCAGDSWGPVTNLINGGPYFDAHPTGATAAIGSHGVVVAVPFSEVDGIGGSRGFSFTTPEEHLYQEEWVGFAAWPKYPDLTMLGGEDTIVIACDYTASTATTTTTTTTTTMTTAAPTTTTTTTIPGAVVAPPEDVDEGGASPIPYFIVGGGLLLFLLGAWIFFRSEKLKDCTKLYERWQAAQKRCDDVRADLERAKATLEERKARLAKIQSELDRLRRARGTFVEQEDGTRFHQIPEGMVTSEGLDDIIGSVDAQAESAQDAVDTAQASVDQWQERVDRHCGEAEAAREAYEGCIGAATAPPPPAPADSGGGSDTGTSPEGDPGATPEDEDPDGIDGSTDGGEDAGGTPPTGGGSGGSGGEQPPPECQPGETKEEVLGTDEFVVPVIDEGMEISIEPPTEEFAEWWEGETAQTGEFSPFHLNDPDLAGTVAATVSGLDSSMAVAHLVTIRIPRQEIRMQCIQHWKCSNGRWGKSRKEPRETGRRRLSDIVITSEAGGPKVSSADVERLIRRAQGRYQQLVQADDRLQQFCT